MLEIGSGAVIGERYGEELSHVEHIARASRRRHRGLSGCSTTYLRKPRWKRLG